MPRIGSYYDIPIIPTALITPGPPREADGPEAGVGNAGAERVLLPAEEAIDRFAVADARDVRGVALEQRLARLAVPQVLQDAELRRRVEHLARGPVGVLLGGITCLTLIRPHLFYACFIVSRATIICYIIRHESLR